MKNYYFTFLGKHITVGGLNMYGYWVRVKADGFDSARRQFILQFSGTNMKSPMDFAMQYEEQEFQPKYYPNGEYAFIQQKTD